VLKLSHYVVATDVINDRGQRVIYSTRTGRRVLVSDTCYQYLLESRADELPQKTRDDLQRNMILVDEHEDELANIISENYTYGRTPQKRLYEVVQPTAMCQLGCYYCGQKHTKDYLADDLIHKLVQRITRKFNSGDYEYVHIGWFGAEPLMGLPQMRRILKQLRASLGEHIRIQGNVVTNGLSLKEEIFLELVHDFNITAIEITLDGIAKYHDQHRYTKSGNNSFDLIYENLKTILRRADFDPEKCKIVIRCNVDEKNVEGVEPLIRRIADDGLHKLIDKLYFVGIYSWAGNQADKISLTKEEFAMRKMKWEILKIQLGYKTAGKLYERKRNTCIATGGATELYDAFGNIYNCSEISYSDFYEKSAYKLGTLSTSTADTDFPDKPHHDWYQKVRDTEEFPCHSCKLLPICGGSCPKAWEEGSKACPPFKFSIRKEIELMYLLETTSDDVLHEKLAGFESTFSISDFKRFE
jgi:uncharacterized protein